ncbi:hypothetical protein FRX31_009933 [Thalictrum thalictroides]|uniref:DUF8040 domain-containing protein n=1 Tax=Thalictrum thalictroides TaxID=46969 RepID=A0A7J6WSW5_THATH|nr:hypothetical protein FRX31_009933 [Thalictrum thalictroides]
MEDDENSRKRKLAVVATAHVAVANAMAASYMLLNIPREPHINRDDERNSYMKSILINEDKCRANLRMGVDAFYELCGLSRQQNIIGDSQNCTLEEVMMRFLHLLGHNVRHRVIEGRFYRSRETVSRHCEVI